MEENELLPGKKASACGQDEVSGAESTRRMTDENLRLRRRVNFCAIISAAALLLFAAACIICLGLKNDLENIRSESDAMRKDLAEMQAQLDDAGNTEPSYLENLGSIPTGTVIDSREIDLCRIDRYFTAEVIPEAVYDRINGRSFAEDCRTELSELRYIKLLHFNFDHEIQVGELIVNCAVSDDICEIFKELFLNQYEIYSMRLIDDFWTGDALSSDDASVEANNSSAFCWRVIAGSDVVSNHAAGMAVDINPQQNPYVYFDAEGNPGCDHQNAVPYLDRTSGESHMIGSGDLCLQLFLEHGFEWGGNYNRIRDYQHFEMIEDSEE